MGNVKESLIPFIKQKVKEFKENREKKKKGEEKTEKVKKGDENIDEDETDNLETTKTKQPEIEAAMPVYEVRFISPVL